MSAVKCLFSANSVNVERVIFARYFGEKKLPKTPLPYAKNSKFAQTNGLKTALKTTNEGVLPLNSTSGMPHSANATTVISNRRAENSMVKNNKVS